MSIKYRIVPDEYPESPREWDNVATLALFHKRYSLGDSDHNINPDDFNSWAEMRKHIESTGAIVEPVYMYEHSGITISTKPFYCPCDSGQVGFAFITKDKIRKETGKKHVCKAQREWAYAQIQAEVETYDQYLTGDVYGYEIFDDTDKDNVLESCWGFYGQEYCHEEASAALKYMMREAA